MRAEEGTINYPEYPDGPISVLPKQRAPTDLSRLPPYSAPDLQKDNSIYLCHDMMGGYKEDTNVHDRFPHHSQAKDAHRYRALHLPQSRIFNYFSHHLITVPPKLWRDLCHKHHVLCLGTFILEGGHTPSQSEYLSQSTADLLVFLARKYQYDGYLINIERPVADIFKLTEFLGRLVERIHAQVPNSEIVWYDSVITTGEVSYQNSLNQKNELFYQICDGIFLNYWWNEANLQSSLKRSLPGKRVYVGNDCFGRNTFGGGKYNTYRAIQTITKVNERIELGDKCPLVPALFAMGFSYEDGAVENREQWTKQEDRIYRSPGSQQIFSQVLTHNKWHYIGMEANGRKWAFEEDWAVTSFELCRRVCNYRVWEKIDANWPDEIEVSFASTVMGTAPKFKDFYRITLQLIQTVDGQQIVRYQESTGNKSAAQEEKVEILSIWTTLKFLASQKVIIRVIEEGKDVEHFAGNYGTRFRQDTLILGILDISNANSWVNPAHKEHKNSHLRNLGIKSLPFSTSFNIGLGNNFYFEGKGIGKGISNYDYLSDCDALYPYFLNGPEQASIYYKEAYFGGTCLRLNFNKAPNNKIALLSISPQAIQKGVFLIRLAMKPLQFPHLQNYNQLMKQIEDGSKLRLSIDSYTCKLHKISQMKNPQWIGLQYQISLSQNLQTEKSKYEEDENIYVCIESSEVDSWLIDRFQIENQDKNNKERPAYQVLDVQIIPSKNKSQKGEYTSDKLIDLAASGKPISWERKLIIKIEEHFACFAHPEPMVLQPNKIVDRIIIKNAIIAFPSETKNITLALYHLNSSSLEAEQFFRQQISKTH